MSYFSKGGNWQVGVNAGYLYVTPQTVIRREIFGLPLLDLEGLPERWVKIVRGEIERKKKLGS